MYIYNLGKFRLKYGHIVYYMLFNIIPIKLFTIESDNVLENFHQIADGKLKFKTKYVVLGNLIKLDSNEITNGKYFVNFIVSKYYRNDPLPANIKIYKGNRLKVEWDNGFSCITSFHDINIYKEIIKDNPEG